MDSSMIGVLDVAVIGGIASLAMYWFFFRKKEEEVNIRDFKVAPQMVRSDSYDPSFINRMKKAGRNVVVFYGSQTGTSEEFAGRLAKDASRYGMKGMPADPEECEMEDLTKLTEIENGLAIFCLATYGEGDPTDNAQEFYDWLQEGNVSFEGVKYAVFGLGNKTYEHYNAMGIYVDKRLQELGAERVFELGLGDDDANIEEDFVTWREKFWPAVCDNFGITSVGEDISFRQYALTEHEEPPNKLFKGEPARYNSFNIQKPPFDAKNPFLAPVTVNRELHKGGDRSCMHIEFDLSGSKIRYEAGDHLAVYPTNDPELVERLGERLKADLGQIFTLTNVDEDASKVHPFPCPTTYRTALSHYLSVTHTPRTNVIKELAEYATEDKDKDFLLQLCSSTPEAKELYNDWVVKPHRTLLHILEDLPSVQPPLDHVCELMPRLQARYYSISSSPKVSSNKVSITAVLTDWVTPTGRRQKGVATHYLRLKQPMNGDIGDVTPPTVPVFVRKSQFRLPFKPSVPIVMVGPGTGLAPFMGFIQDRNMQKKDGKPIGEAVLYFGCRKSTEDYIYEEELGSYLEDGTLTHVRVAFSRDQEQKVYVQDLLRQKENSDELWKYLEQGAHFYVCGDAKHMAQDVDKCLKDIVMSYGGLEESAAVDYLKRMRTRGRYSCDVWS